MDRYVYLYEYTLEIEGFIDSHFEKKSMLFTDVSLFIETVKNHEGREHIKDRKTYKAKVEELPIEKVLNPF